MKRLVVPALGLFLFGTFSLPGKVCPTVLVVAHADDSAVPPCHRSPSAGKRQSPCDRMVCCLVPEVIRGASSAWVPPAPVVQETLFLSVLNDRPTPVPDPLCIEHEAPPGVSAGVVPSRILRGPPLA